MFIRTFIFLVIVTATVNAEEEIQNESNGSLVSAENQTMLMILENKFTEVDEILIKMDTERMQLFFTNFIKNNPTLGFHLLEKLINSTNYIVIKLNSLIVLWSTIKTDHVNYTLRLEVKTNLISTFSNILQDAIVNANFTTTNLTVEELNKLNDTILEDDIIWNVIKNLHSKFYLIDNILKFFAYLPSSNSVIMTKAYYLREVSKSTDFLKFNGKQVLKFGAALNSLPSSVAEINFFEHIRIEVNNRFIKINDNDTNLIILVDKYDKNRQNTIWSVEHLYNDIFRFRRIDENGNDVNEFIHLVESNNTDSNSKMYLTLKTVDSKSSEWKICPQDNGIQLFNVHYEKYLCGFDGLSENQFNFYFLDDFSFKANFKDCIWFIHVEQYL